MILLSMLGTTDYKEVVCTWGEKKACPSKFFQTALAEWFPDAQVMILVTQEAKEKHGKAIGESLPNAQLIDIPPGMNEAEYWEIFNTIERHIPSEAELVFDLTHGFRSLPILALLAANFLRVAKQVRVRHVLYGAYEARSGDTAPVFELTPFITLLDWASATDRFLDTGDGGKLADITGSYSDMLRDSVNSLKDFSYELQLQNPKGAGQKAKEILEQLDRIERELPPPMKILKKRLENSISPLSFTKQDPDDKQLRALFKHILWYNEHAFFEKALGLANEWIHLFVKWKVGKPIWTTVNFSLTKELERRDSEDWTKKLRDLYEEIKRLRNLTAHFHIGKNGEFAPGQPDPKRVRGLIRELENIVSGAGLNL